MTFDGNAFGAQIVEVVRGFLERELLPVISRMEAIERRFDNLPVPRDGKDADLAEVHRMIGEEIGALKTAVEAIEPAPVLPDINSMIAVEVKSHLPLVVGEAVEVAVASIPKPKDGLDGKDADQDVMREMVANAVKQAIEDHLAYVPPPYQPTDDEIVSLVRPVLDYEVGRAIAALPKPQDGTSVTIDDVRPLIMEEVAKSVSALPAPKDGVGLAGALIDRNGELVVTLSNGETKNLGPVVGKDGDPGRDGFRLEDFDASVMDDGRTVLLSFSRGDLDYKIELGFPVMLYRGVYREQQYQKGDTVTWAGSVWHCDAATTTEKPGDGSADWTLCAKKGRDGKDGIVKEVKAIEPVRVGMPARKD